MSQIIIPESGILDPSRVIQPAETAVYDSVYKSSALQTDEKDIAGNQDPPGYQNGSPGGAGAEGNFIQYSSTDAKDTGTWTSLNNFLKVTESQAWKENGRNPNIIQCVAACNVITENDKTPPWCAGFVAYVLQQSGFNSIRSLSSQAYKKYGKPVDWRDWQDVRKNDIIIFKSKTGPGGHIGFVSSYNPKTGRVAVYGGNQRNDARISNFTVNGPTLYVTDVRRGWEIPKSADVSIINGNSTDVLVDPNTR
jgi:uncharacterized protein (TIGR02594 family)